MRPRISNRGCVRQPSVRRSVGPSVTLSWKVEKWNIYSPKNMTKLIWYVCFALPHLYDRICPSVGLSVRKSGSLSSSTSFFSPRMHRWPLGLVCERTICNQYQSAYFFIFDRAPLPPIPIPVQQNLSLLKSLGTPQWHFTTCTPRCFRNHRRHHLF